MARIQNSSSEDDRQQLLSISRTESSAEYVVDLVSIIEQDDCIVLLMQIIAYAIIRFSQKACHTATTEARYREHLDSPSERGFKY